MKFNQYYLDCLSHASLPDRRRDHRPRRRGRPAARRVRIPRRCQGLGMTIELVIETHFHADFLSGHLELAKATGAKIVYSSVAETEFDFMPVDDGERYSLGDGDTGVPPHPRAHPRVV